LLTRILSIAGSSRVAGKSGCGSTSEAKAGRLAGAGERVLVPRSETVGE
jgi:hypothetical protein